MEVNAPEAGMPIERDMIVVIGLHQVIVRRHGARPIRLKFLLDSQRQRSIDGHFEMEYELVDGSTLKVYCKLQGRSMLFKVSRGAGQLNYSVDIDKYVDEDLVPLSMPDYEDMVRHWLSD